MQQCKQRAERGSAKRTMNAAAGSCGGRRRLGWWAALLALVGATSDVPRFGLSTVAAQPEVHRLAAQAPPSWQEFAQQLQSKLVQRLATRAEAVGRLANQMAGGADTDGAEPRTVTARVWVSRDGKIERLEFDGLDDATAKELRTLVSRDEVGQPPPDMLQPIHLRLSLRPKSDQQQMQ
jgi:hypothetical protein